MATFRTNDGVTLSYTDNAPHTDTVGDGAGRPVVLIHGYTAPAAAWAFTIDALLENGYRAIAFDRRCHGESETPAYGQRMARHGRDIGEFLDHLGLTPPQPWSEPVDGRQRDLGVRRPVRLPNGLRQRSHRGPDTEDDQ